ncbi:hypothetical protein ACFL03_02305 [Thermodesulfobacteriota bacterium]
MEITLVGYILIPVGLFAVISASRQKLLYLLIFFTPFTATAVVNFDNPHFGIQPAYFFGLLFMARTATDTAVKKVSFSIYKGQYQSILPFWLFTIVLLLSILAIPVYGHMEVYRPSGELELLRFSQENLTQFIYIIYVIGLTTSIGLFRIRPEQIDQILKLFIFSGLFVALWGWLQVSMYYLGYSYPDFIFNNNNSFSQGFNQLFQTLGVKRMNSVAPEPSMLARFLLIPTFISFYCVYKKHFLFNKLTSIILSVLFAFSLICTTSSSAMLYLIGGVPIFILFTFISSRQWQVKRKTALSDRSKKTILTVLLLLAVFMAILFGLLKWKFNFELEDIIELLDIIILKKMESGSAHERLGGALFGLKLFASHPLLGVGWGSNRTFDLLTNLLSTSGLFGIFFFMYAHVALAVKSKRLIRHLMRYGFYSLAGYPEVSLLVLIMILFGKIISDPILIFLDHWVIVGLLIACLRWQTLFRYQSR